jgi:predicted nucleic-acid-binding Zn-ribbon protein
MDSPVISVAMKCPRCGNESFAKFQIAAVAEALILENPIRIHAPCHDEWWTASYSERQQIREQLIVVVEPIDALSVRNRRPNQHVDSASLSRRANSQESDPHPEGESPPATQEA